YCIYDKRHYATGISLFGVYRIYSPALIYAWRDIEHEEVDSEDWFTDWQVVNYLVDKEENINGQITEDYCKTLEKIELAILAKKNVLLR
ncbi:hypothetical protein ACT453_45525, partial [Bacillus sp. D-CC]